MVNGKFGVAVWGCGWVAGGHIGAYLKNRDCVLVGLGSRRPESVREKIAEYRLENVTEYPSYEAVLNDPRVDIVSICTPNDLHAEEAMLAAKAGKQIFLEKPVAITEESMDRLVKTLDEYHTKTIVGLILRFHKLTALQKRLIDGGDLGKIFLANVDYWFGRDRGSWMREGARVGGAFVLGGCHSVDLARYLIGSDIVSVRGTSTQPGSYYDYPPVETAQVRFANGAIGAFSCSLVGFNPFTANTHILGTDGTILNDRFYLRRFQEQQEFFRIDTGTKKTGDVSGHPFPAMVDHFIGCLKEDRDSPHNVRSAVNAQKACLAISRSAREGGVEIAVG